MLRKTQPPDHVAAGGNGESLNAKPAEFEQEATEEIEIGKGQVQ
jgi:hypothetical protein